MQKLFFSCVVAAFCSLGFLSHPASAQVPQLINYQGRVTVDTVNFDGSGQFKFALVNANGTTTFWSNDGTSNAGSQPTTAVSLTVTKGLYSLLLGDSSVTNMTAIPTGVFTNSDVRLRVWFNDGTNGSQLLTPDQRLAPNGYLPDGSVSSAAIASGAITSAKIVSGAVGSAQLAPNLTLGGTTTGAFTGSGTTAFQTVAGTAQGAVANTNYLLTNAALSTVTLPSAPIVGDVVRINGVGAGGWQAAPNTSQSIVGAGSTVGPAGVTWTARDFLRSWRSVASSADGTKLVAAGDQLYTSTDSGVTWTARESVRPWTCVASSADGSKLVAAGGGSGGGGQLYTSTDSGVNWTAQESVRYWQGVASSSDGSKLIATVYPGQLYTSTDSGVTWTPRESSRGWYSVASSADGTKLVAGTAVGQLYTSTDSGVTWTPRESSRSWAAVASSADGTKLVAGDYAGQLYTSTDSGVTWTARESNRKWQGVASSSDGTKLVAGATVGDQLYTSTDSGVTWAARENNRNWWGVASSADGTKLVAAPLGGQLYTSTSSMIGNPLAGAAGTTVGLQYIGNNQWQALTEANAASAISFSGSLAGDITGTQSATVVSLVGGSGAASVHSAELLANAAASSNTANAIVKRDASGNFSAGTITGNLNGNATTASTAGSVAAANVTGTITNAQLGSPSITINTGSGLSGGGTVALGGTLTLQATGVTSLTGGGGITVSGATGAVTLGSNGTSANSANTLVMRDGSGNFSGGNITSSGNISLPATDATGNSGVFQLNGQRLLHAFRNDFYGGLGCGNFNMTGFNNTAIGTNSFYSNTTGIENVALGGLTLSQNTTGSKNTAIGINALFSNTTGYQNTGIGRQALYSNLDGIYNTAVGSGVLIGNSSGSANTAMGQSGLASNTVGSENTAIGSNALFSNTTAGSNVAVGNSSLSTQSYSNSGLAWDSYNVAVGWAALQSNQPTSTFSGISNTAIGAFALNSNTTGGNNIAVGKYAGFAIGTGSNNICIGNQGNNTDAATIRIGSATQTKAFIAGIRGVTTGQVNAINVLIDSNGQLGTVSSSRRYKEDIADMGRASAQLLALRPVTFHYKKAYDNGEKPIQFGLIAEEVAEAFPELAVFNEHGQPETVKYQDLAPMLLNEFLKDHRRADAKDVEIAELKQRLAELEAKDKAREKSEKEREARVVRLESLLPHAPVPTALETAAATSGL